MTAMKRWVMCLLLIGTWSFHTGTAGAATAKKKASPQKTAAKPVSPWVVYSDAQLGIKLQVPRSWKIKTAPGMVGFSQKVRNVEGGLGILRSQVEGESIEKAAKKQYKREGKPKNWSQTTTQVAGCRAIRVMTDGGPQSEKQLVQYYVETPAGNYLIQCLATVSAWPKYDAIFQKMLASLTFLK